MTKRDFLVVYDYGSGGVWGVISAVSTDQISARLPDLTVIDDVPEWMSADLLARLDHFDIDGVLPEWARPAII